MAAPRDGLLGGLAKRSGLGEFAPGFGHIGAFMSEIIRYRAAQIGIGDVMRGIGGLREISARDLVLALRARFDCFQTAPDRKVDSLVIADLEMQKRVMFDRAPVAAKQRFGADEIDGAGNPATVAPGHDERNVLSHGFADQRKEAAGEVGPAPFPRTGMHVESEEGIPGVFSDVVAGERVNRNAVSERIAPFAPDRLAVTRVERIEKILKTSVAAVVPMKLLVVTLQESLGGQKLPFGLARKRHVNGRGFCHSA